MPYCTPDDVRALNQLFTIVDFPDVYIATYISKAQARIDNRMAPHYKVPFPDPVPTIINSICADMAAALMCEHHFSGINYREETPLADIFRKRADADLEFTIENATIDAMPGVSKREPDLPEMRKKVASTTTQPSPMQATLKKYDWATQIPLSNVREWP